jgi:hypothetical protein
MGFIKVPRYLEMAYWWLRGRCHVCHEVWRYCPGHKGEPTQNDVERVSLFFFENPETDGMPFEPLPTLPPPGS